MDFSDKRTYLASHARASFIAVIMSKPANAKWAPDDSAELYEVWNKHPTMQHKKLHDLLAYSIRSKFTPDQVSHKIKNSGGLYKRFKASGFTKGSGDCFSICFCFCFSQQAI
jgi:hypothetical protein